MMNIPSAEMRGEKIFSPPCRFLAALISLVKDVKGHVISEHSQYLPFHL